MAEQEVPAKGTVMRSTGSFYRVRLEDGSVLEATIRGKFRLKGYKSTNPIAVGDHVVLDLKDPGQGPVITDILPRENYILRRSTKSSAQVQILAANVDQALMIFTLKEPFTALGYLDRFLVMCEAYHVPAVVIINKADLLVGDEKQWAKLEDIEVIYEDIGYRVETISAHSQAPKEMLTALLKDKVSFLAGASGAGKSTLVNLVDPALDLRTNELAKHSGRGRHTTTYAEMHPLSVGGYVIDAPGFKEFNLYDIAPEELSGYFPEMRALVGQCKYHNCLHLQEPGCAVRAAVEAGEVSPTRYNTYQHMLEDLRQQPSY